MESAVQEFGDISDSFAANLNVTKGWVRVAHIDMTNTNQQCPKNFQLSYTQTP